MPGATLCQVAQDLGLNKGMLGRWKQQLEVRGEIEEGERCSPNRVVLLMQTAGLKGDPQRKQWQKKTSGVRPDAVSNHLERDFAAAEP